jgi:hypothetical protein
MKKSLGFGLILLFISQLVSAGVLDALKKEDKACRPHEVYNARERQCVDRCHDEGRGHWDPVSNTCSKK